ncbi:DASS family sodium-coupled anion symporter [Candidatus Woesearchaeota archaeon]|nr:DASS family sodium-coupled anion symporter [Candidatus Woesearchaeota archaeon]
MESKRGVALAIALALVCYFMFPISFQARVVLAIAVFTAVLWFTDAIPQDTTALAIPFLLVVLGGFAPADVFTPFFDPIIALLLGGFMLGRVIHKEGLATMLASRIMIYTGTSPYAFLFFAMAATAFLSMWMSNTASAAIMLPVAIMVAHRNRLAVQQSNYGKALVLGIAFAASIGGVGTPIGSSPNALAVRLLTDRGLPISFLDWMQHALPVMLIELVLAWILLLVLYQPEKKVLRSPVLWTIKTRKQKTALAIAVLTVVLWLSESVHGIHYSVIALLPVLLFALFRITDKEDIKRIDWHVLLLVGGGLTLGKAVVDSGLEAYLVSMVPLQTAWALGAVVFLSIALTTLISNTAVAAMLLPVLLPMAGPLGIPLRTMAMAISIAVSFSFILPISTPPNAMAYATGYVRVHDMMKAGFVLSFIGGFLLIFMG